MRIPPSNLRWTAAGRQLGMTAAERGQSLDLRAGDWRRLLRNNLGLDEALFLRSWFIIRETQRES
ncbi:hypothetical protein GTO91_15995 [Heliobacterium undosum]|uniref:Uncharacterized protein n=1 Tax=Heliomicrobium undosum TaxID=121734 RepID=A0A845L9A4_9FIRM|nr:hypothetical protein [Heliomicrobium undosum]MZP31210.1 hypothetical protein [Heliomicrobium undosum]